MGSLRGEHRRFTVTNQMTLYIALWTHHVMVASAASSLAGCKGKISYFCFLKSGAWELQVKAPHVASEVRSYDVDEFVMLRMATTNVNLASWCEACRWLPQLEIYQTTWLYSADATTTVTITLEQLPSMSLYESSCGC